MTANEIIELVKWFKKLELKKTPVDYHVQIENTGLVEKNLKRFEPKEWKEYKDLGGRKVTITIEIPNKD